MKFLADCMLGKLCRWMRILGFDVLYMKGSDEEILKTAEREKRIILTKDSRMGHKKFMARIYFVKNENWKGQIKEVLEEFSLREKIKPFTRCPECNTPLKIVNRGRVRFLVPSFIYQKEDEFALCKKCEKIFWQGSHLKDMGKKIKDILDYKN
ncbi:MAG: DUF5615 family PIN-like protein [Candidatus Aminicenantia bacterium]